MEAMETPDEAFENMFFTDYNPTDIDKININELLSQPGMQPPL